MKILHLALYLTLAVSAGLMPAQAHQNSTTEPLVQQLLDHPLHLPFGLQPSPSVLARLAGKKNWAALTQFRSTKQCSTGEATATFDAYDIKVCTVQGKKYIVVIEKRGNYPIPIPGTAAAHLLLLDMQGNLLDKIGCHISTRSGLLETEQTSISPPEFAIVSTSLRGAQDKEPKYFSGCPGSHSITYRGKDYSYSGSTAYPPSVTLPSAGPHTRRQFLGDEGVWRLQACYVPPNGFYEPVWMRKGLLRVGIKDNHFIVNFPSLRIDDEHRERWQHALHNDPEEEIHPYLKNMARNIVKNWTYSEEPDGYHRYEMEITLDRNGIITEMKTTEPSSSESVKQVLDQPAKNAVQSAQPFGRLPDVVKEHAPKFLLVFDEGRLDRGFPRENINAVMKNYMKELKANIMKNWKPPAFATHHRTSLNFVIEPSGKITRVSLCDPVIDPASEAAAIAALRQSEPNKPFPSAIDFALDMAIDFYDERIQGTRRVDLIGY